MEHGKRRKDILVQRNLLARTGNLVDLALPTLRVHGIGDLHGNGKVRSVRFTWTHV